MSEMKSRIITSSVLHSRKNDCNCLRLENCLTCSTYTWALKTMIDIERWMSMFKPDKQLILYVGQLQQKKKHQWIPPAMFKSIQSTEASCQ